MDALTGRARQFNVTTEVTPGRMTARLEGELDIATADTLATALDGLNVKAGDQLVVDMREVEFMDSTGLRVLITANRHAISNKHRLILVTGDSPAERVLRLTRMDDHLEVVAKIEDLPAI
ncbi:MAG TPA: STAS domain-containing protein [Solirubrobacterales bacterium]|jgi:anti-anti-sigma factor|nr:STAS domain-containing protein [Solirubrobacterales bacterium]